MISVDSNTRKCFFQWSSAIKMSFFLCMEHKSIDLVSLLCLRNNTVRKYHYFYAVTLMTEESEVILEEGATELRRPQQGSK